MYKNTYFAPIEKTTETRISPPPIKPNFSIKKRPAEDILYHPMVKKQRIFQ
jgi:hypothetical protein